jgi:hypothetical protein
VATLAVAGRAAYERQWNQRVAHATSTATPATAQSAVPVTATASPARAQPEEGTMPPQQRPRARASVFNRGGSRARDAVAAAATPARVVAAPVPAPASAWKMEASPETSRHSDDRYAGDRCADSGGPSPLAPAPAVGVAEVSPTRRTLRSVLHAGTGAVTSFSMPRV